MKVLACGRSPSANDHLKRISRPLGPSMAGQRPAQAFATCPIHEGRLIGPAAQHPNRCEAVRQTVSGPLPSNGRASLFSATANRLNYRSSPAAAGIRYRRFAFGIPTFQPVGAGCSERRRQP